MDERGSGTGRSLLDGRRCDGDLSVVVPVVGALETDKPGTYQIFTS